MFASKRVRRLTVTASTLLLTAVGPLLTSCQTSPYEYSVKPSEYSGVRLYQVFCSSCHGLTGLGDGPVEPLFRGGVPDLAHLAARNGGAFPADDVRSAVDGRETFVAHGVASMPVWGFEFYEGGDSKLARQRSDEMINRLVRYVGEMQVN